MSKIKLQIGGKELIVDTVIEQITYDGEEFPRNTQSAVIEGLVSKLKPVTPDTIEKLEGAL